LTLTFYLKKNTWLLEIGIRECTTDSSIRNWIIFFLDEGVFHKQILPKLLISRLLNLECIFLLWIAGSGMFFFWIRNAYFCYGLVDLEWFFWMMDFWMWNAYFELQIGGSEILAEVPIQIFSRFHNPECKKINTVQVHFRVFKK